MSFHELVSGFALGLGFLALIAILMIIFERKLPFKWFFLCASVIILYLAFKFMGSGIHSLQLAGWLPNTTSYYLPSLTILGIYPSWFSFLPQLIMILLALFLFYQKNLRSKKIGESLNEKRTGCFNTYVVDFIIKCLFAVCKQ